MTSYPVSLSTTLNFTTSTSYRIWFGRTLDDALVCDDEPMGALRLALDLSEAMAMSSAVLPVLAVSLNQDFELSGAATYKWIAGAVLQDIARLSDQPSPLMTYQCTIADALALSSALTRTIPVALQSGVTIHGALAAGIGVYLVEKLKLGDGATNIVQYHLALADALGLFDTLARFLWGSLSESVNLASVLASQYTSFVALTELLTTLDSPTGQLLFKLTLSDDIVAEDANIVQMIFAGQLSEIIDLSVLYVSPSGNFTTFAINTRTNAISQYSRNWVFNSFAQVGQKYIAANSQGLYELNGALDAGNSIIGVLRGGYLQLAGSHLSGIKGLYIGMQGEGKYLLKLVAGDGREYLYRFKGQPNLMTTKVNVGKGLRTRYLQWELVTMGEPFDLDTLEFVPMISTRRV